MTHIIGKPPAPKGEATFADLHKGDIFKTEDGRLWCKNFSHKALEVDRHGPRDEEFAPSTPVTIMTVTPRDPEPDPAVTTWRELKPGEWFVWIGNQGATSGPCRKISASTYSEEKRDKACEYIAECDVQSVRPVPASVVVHEEPGARVRVFAAGMATVDLGGNLEVEVDHAELAAIVRQGAALLAQEPASSQSGEPEPTELQAGDRIGVVFEGCSDDVHDLRVGIVKRQPAEDRSRPAPGWSLDEVGDGTWSTVRPDGVLWSVDHESELDARGETWRRHDLGRAGLWTRDDAQQAGKGDES